jgi:hypothetical protein
MNTTRALLGALLLTSTFAPAAMANWDYGPTGRTRCRCYSAVSGDYLGSLTYRNSSLPDSRGDYPSPYQKMCWPRFGKHAFPGRCQDVY